MNQIKRKNKQIYHRLIVGLFIGLVLFMIPFAFDAYTSYREKPEVEKYTTAAKKPPSKLGAAIKYNKAIYDSQKNGIATGLADYKKVNSDETMPIGYISIPAIKVENLLMYYGSSDWVLNRGLGILNWGSLPTGGKNTRSIITGHSGLANRVYFDNIKDLHNGDKIYVNSYNQKMAYSVYGRKVIKPNDQKELKKLYVKQGKDEIVLITCTPIFVNSDRLLIFAKRIKLDAAQKDQVVRRDLFSLTHIWLAVIILFIIVLFTWYFLTSRKQRKLLMEAKDGENS